MSPRAVAAFCGFATLLCAACRPDVPSPVEGPHAASTVEHPVVEGALSVVHLSAEAVKHLGVERDEVKRIVVGSPEAVLGFVTVPPGRALAAMAPVAGTLHAGDVPLLAGAAVARGDLLLRMVPLAPVDRDMKAQAKRQRAATTARLNLAQARLDRLTRLLAERASSPRAIEEATAERDTAQAEDDAARARQRAIARSPLAADVTLPIFAPSDGLVRTLSAAVGQTVVAGAPLFEVVAADQLWVRVPVLAGDLDRVNVQDSVEVGPLTRSTRPRSSATPVTAPPSADPVAATVDLYYALEAGSPFTRPGERVLVQRRTVATGPMLTVPSSAVVVDFDGGSWVYTCDGDGFTRVRVEIGGHHDERALILRGPAVGTCVVAVGAMELLGAEFGVDH